MFPDKKDAPDHNTWLSEMSEGVEVLGKRGGTSVPAEDEGKLLGKRFELMIF